MTPLPSRSLALAAVAVLGLAAAPAAGAAKAKPRSAHRTTGVDRVLRAGQTLKPNQSLRSSNRRYTLRMQTDGNLVLTAEKPHKVLWSAQTGRNPGATATLQRDGNLVVYGRDRTALYASGTHGSGFRLIVQDDGNVVVYGGSDPKWATAGDAYGVSSNQVLRAGQGRTSPNGAYYLTMQPDGNLVVYASATHAPQWSTQTNVAGAYAALGGDGNLVVYAPDRTPLYSSAQLAGDGARLIMQDDGNLVVYGADRKPRWASKVETSTLYGGQTLHVGQSRVSVDGRFLLTAQPDGNLVLYQNAGHKPLWSSVTGGLGGGATTLQGDGNLVVAGPDGRPTWSAGTHADASAHLVVQTDGNVVLQDGADHPLWSTGTGGR